jgi:hypothetical protein
VLRGTSIEMAGKYAAMAGRDNLYGSDALSGLASWKTMTREVTAGTKRNFATPVLERFVFCPKTLIYNAQ